MQVLHCAPYRDAEGKPRGDGKHDAAVTLGPNWMELLEAEDSVIESFANRLDDDYHLICNAQMLDEGPDADMILVGPTGVWAVEFVHYSGDFKATSEKWLAYDSNKKDYAPANPNPVAAARDNAVVIYDFLHSQDLPVPWVNGVVILTDSNINVYTDSPAVAIVRREEVYQFVTQEVRDLDPVMDEADVAAIVEALRPFFTASAVVEAAPSSAPKVVSKNFLGLSSAQWAIILALALLNICVLIGIAWFAFNR